MNRVLDVLRFLVVRKYRCCITNYIRVFPLSVRILAPKERIVPVKETNKKRPPTVEHNYDRGACYSRWHHYRLRCELVVAAFLLSSIGLEYHINFSGYPSVALKFDVQFGYLLSHDFFQNHAIFEKKNFRSHLLRQLCSSGSSMESGAKTTN